MKHGILLYTPEDAARNRWFIEHLIQYAEPEGMSLRLCLTSECDPDGIFDDDTAFFINRSRFASYSEAAEKRNIPCFNSAEVTAITNDKYQTYLHLHGKHGIPMAKTELVTAKNLRHSLRYPLVAKPADGHGGAGVAWITDADKLKQYVCADPFLVQEPVVTGWDVRVYILGGDIYSAVLRTSDLEFRSNASLGGHTQLLTPDAEMRDLVNRVQQHMPLDFAGVDLLRFPEGGYLLGEIEDAVGCRMLYRNSSLDPAKDFIRHIRSRLA